MLGCKKQNSQEEGMGCHLPLSGASYCGVKELLSYGWVVAPGQWRRREKQWDVEEKEKWGNGRALEHEWIVCCVDFVFLKGKRFYILPNKRIFSLKN